MYKFIVGLRVRYLSTRVSELEQELKQKDTLLKEALDLLKELTPPQLEN